MKHHASGLHSLKITVIVATLLLIFVSWLLSVFLPITFIELGYQYRKTLNNSFNVTSLKELLLPHLTMNSTSSSPSHENGIRIPAIFIDEPIIFNVDPNNASAYLEALKHGIAHASGTAFPGTDGLGYYFAHSSLPAFVSKFNAVFYLLDKLQIGDTISIRKGGVDFDYIVYAKQLTSADDVSFLNRKFERDAIVLQTCWPPGTSARRLLVFATEKSQ